MNDNILASRQRSYNRTAAQFEVYASKAQDQKLTAAEDAEWTKLSEILERKHVAVMRALKAA